MIKFFNNFLLLITLGLASPAAYGWSSASHRVIAQIAADHISSNTKQQILALTGEDLQVSATWPDLIKNDSIWKHTKGYHYKEMDDGSSYLDNCASLSSTLKKKGDVLRAILKAETMLRDPAESQENKKNALRFYVHLIGDIHQPLHAGFTNDGGGNNVGVTWFTYQTNLHSVWDTTFFATFAANHNLTKSSPASDYIGFIRVPTTSEIKTWQGSTVLDWLNESLEARHQAYTGYSGDSQTYYDNNIGLVNDRLLQAGYRLASALESIFAKAPPSPANAALLKNLDKSLGTSSNSGIDLTPQ